MDQSEIMVDIDRVDSSYSKRPSKIEDDVSVSGSILFEASLDKGKEKKNHWICQRLTQSLILAFILVVAVSCAGIVVFIKSRQQTEKVLPTNTSIQKLPSPQIEESAYQSTYPTVIPFVEVETKRPVAEKICKYKDVSALLRGEIGLKNAELQSEANLKAIDWLKSQKYSAQKFCNVNAIIEKYVLALLYYGTDGENWNDQLNFLDEDNHCSWNKYVDGGKLGVSCSGSRSVEEIILRKNGLTFEIPTELGLLKSLKLLDLSLNEFNNTIPMELGRIRGLQNLVLSQSFLTNTIPSELGNLSNLRRLRLQYNLLSRTIPTQLGRMKNLRILQMHSSYLSGEMPSELGMLSQLKEISLYFNNINGTIPTEMGNMKRVNRLHLELNKLVGPLPSELGKLQQLSDVSIFLNHLSSSIPSEVGNIVNMKRMKLHYNKLTGSIPSEIGKLTSLKELSLFSNMLTGTVPHSLSELENLYSIEVHAGNMLKGDAMFLCEIANVTVYFWCNEIVQRCSCCECYDYNLTDTEYELNDEEGHEQNSPYQTPLVEDLDQVSTEIYMEYGDYVPSSDIGHESLTTNYDSDTEHESSTNPNLSSYINAMEYEDEDESTSTDIEDNATSNINPSTYMATDNSPSSILVDEFYIQNSATSNINPSTYTVENNSPSSVLVDEFYDTPPSHDEIKTQISANPSNGKSDSSYSFVPSCRNYDSIQELLSTEMNISVSQSVYNPANKAQRLRHVAYQWINSLSSSINMCNTNTIVETYVLVLLYFSAGGEYWTSKLNFLSSGDVCSWNDGANLGVFCNDFVVSKINLRKNNLTHGIPTEIGHLASLSDLDLSYNVFSNTIPSEVGMLENLKSLSIFGSQITGTIPTELGQLSLLNRMRLWYNLLNGQVPSHLGHLTQLSKIYLENNYFSGSIPTEMGNIKLLTEMSFSFNNIGGTLPSELGKLTDMKILRLDRNYITGMIPSELGKLQKLEYLSVYGNKLRGHIPKMMGMMQNVETLKLHYNSLSGSVPPVLGSLSKLKVLTLHNNDFTNTIPRSFLNLTDLEVLDVSMGNEFLRQPDFLCSLEGLSIRIPCNTTEEKCVCCQCWSYPVFNITNLTDSLDLNESY